MNTNDHYEYDNDVEMSTGEKQQQQQCSLLEEMPLDVMNTILSFLLLQDLDMLSCVSKQINEAITRTNHLFMASEMSDIRLSKLGMQKLLSRFRCLNTLSLYGLSRVGDQIFEIINQSPTAKTLHEISLYGCFLSYWCSSSLELKQLTRMTIMGGSIRVSCMGSFITSSSSSKNLKSLTIGQCNSLRDEHVNAMAQQLHDNLERLELQQCLRVKSPTLQFGNLKSLCLVGCYALQDPHLCIPTLEELKLTFCFRLDGTRIQDIVQSCPRLKHLSLTKCPQLQFLNIVSSSLETLNISLNNNMKWISLSCDRLVSIEMTCTMLSRCRLASSRLQQLSFATMLSLEELELHCSTLIRLDLCGCERLVPSNCFIHCPNLQVLDICGCTGLSSKSSNHYTTMLRYHGNRDKLLVKQTK